MYLSFLEYELFKSLVNIIYIYTYNIEIQIYNRN